jgi:hypothetical protein
MIVISGQHYEKNKHERRKGGADGKWERGAVGEKFWIYDTQVKEK